MICLVSLPQPSSTPLRVDRDKVHHRLHAFCLNEELSGGVKQQLLRQFFCVQSSASSHFVVHRSDREATGAHGICRVAVQLHRL